MSLIPRTYRNRRVLYDGFSIEERREWALEFVDFCFRKVGHFNVPDILCFFSTFSGSAAVDVFRCYRERAPENSTYVQRRRQHLPGEAFSPLYDGRLPWSFWRDTERRRNGNGLAEFGFLGGAFSSPVTLSPTGELAADVTLGLMVSISYHRRAMLRYRFTDSAQPRNVEISPHALAHNSRAWFVRGYCFDEGRFRNFALAETEGVEQATGPPVDSTDDVDWYRRVPLVLSTPPTLAALQKEAVEREWGMFHGRVTVLCRRGLLVDTLGALGFSINVPGYKSVGRGIVLENLREVRRYVLATC